MNEQITTAAELDALPVGSVMRLRTGSIVGRRHEHEPAGLNFVALGSPIGYTWAELAPRLPATVLYRPDQSQRVQPSREDVARRILDKTVGVVDCELHERLMTPMWDRATSAADAVLALFAQQPTVAEVKAEALREAANDENSEWARKRTEDELIEFRDARIGLVNRRNGLVVYERDGEPSSIIRLGFEMAWKSALRDLADRIEREARP